MNTLNLIWQTSDGDQTNFELDYITNIVFKNFQQNKFFDNGKLETVLDNSVIIYSNNSNEISKEFDDYLDKFVKNKYSFYLLHLSNENLNHNYEYYKKANYVLRCYFDKNITSDNVINIPLGVKSGFLSKNSDTANNEKKYDFAFIGQIKSDRNNLLENIQNYNSFIHTTNQWNCPTSLTQKECSEVYSKTKYVPCPMGWTNPDSFRIMEVLESGSIPVIKRYNNLDYFKNVWGYTPVPIVDDWSELHHLAKIDDKEYNVMLDTILNWYQNFKTLLSNKIENIIVNSKNKIIKSLIHFITPLYRYNNLKIIYSTIINQIDNFSWHLIEGSNKIGEESIDSILSDSRVFYYKINTNFIWGHEQRNFFIKNTICNNNDWCYFLDDDNIVTQDLIETISSEKNSEYDVILFSQKKGLTEKIRLYGEPGCLKLGLCDIGSFAIRYKLLKNYTIPYENQRNADGHYAEHLSRIVPHNNIKYCLNKFTRYNSLSLEIS